MKYLALSLFFLSLGSSCSTKRELRGNNYELFENTPAWDLAKAVRDEDIKEVEKLVGKTPTIINYQEPKFGNTLLMLTILNQQKKPFRTLLSLNADVNIHNASYGTSAIIDACRYSDFDIQFVEALLEKGANVNDIEAGGIQDDNTQFTPLMVAAGANRLDLIELLLRFGADLNYQNEAGRSILTEAALGGKYEMTLYLLQKGANFRRPLFQRPNGPVYLVDFLREVFKPLGSREHFHKMEIVKFLGTQGIDYWSAPIPDYIKRKAQEKYPSYWEEYLKKY